MPVPFTDNHIISTLTLEQLISQVKTSTRSKDYLVTNYNVDNQNLALETIHRANFFCIILIEEGISDYSTLGKKCRIQKGDILFSPKSEPFIINYISDDYKAKYIFFSANFIADAGFNYKSSDILNNLSGSPSSIITGEQELYSRLMSSITQLEVLNDGNNQDYYVQELIWMHFSLLIYEIDNYNKRVKKNSLATSREEDITTQFFELLREHFNEHHDVQFYADQLFISRKYLTRVVSKTIGKSTRDVINNVLLIEAKLMLKSKTTNINEVAEALKFSDQAVFSKFFKKHTGQTPREYRKNDLF